MTDLTDRISKRDSLRIIKGVTGGVFITGTDTGVGKTVVAGRIARAMRERGINVGVMKPIHTGCRKRKRKLIPADSIYLMKSACVNDPVELVTPFMFREPAAPLVTAKNSNRIISIEKIMECFNELCRRHTFMIVEGVGGACVPITKDFFIGDLISMLGLPAIIVSRPDIGTINHTLLTIDYLRKKDITIEGVIINYTRRIRKSIAEKTCGKIIEELSGIKVIMEIVYEKGVGPR